MKKNTEQLTGKNATELAAEETRMRKELFDLEFKHSTRQLSDTMSIKKARRQLARVLTFKTQKQAPQAEKAG